MTVKENTTETVQPMYVDGSTYHESADHLMINGDSINRTSQMPGNLDTRKNSDEHEILNLEWLVLSCLFDPYHSHQVEGESIGEDDFLNDHNKNIFKALKEAKKSKEVGHLLDKVKEALAKSGELQEIGGPLGLSKLSSYAPPSTDVRDCFEKIHRRTATRRLTSVSRGLADDLAMGKDPYEILKSLGKKVESIEANKPNADSALRYLLDLALEEDLVKEIRNTSPGVRIGFEIGEIDLKIPGGAITIVAGPTGHGKTMVLINFILNYLELHPDKQACFFSYEESRAAIQCLFLNTYVNSELSKNNRESIKSYFRDGHAQFIAQDSQDIFFKGKESFFNELINTGRLRIFYSDCYAEELVQGINFLRKNTDVGLVAIDYMQLLNLQNKKTISRQEELKQICLMLKDCAVHTGLPLLLAAQFNRTVVKEADLHSSAIGEAGDIERAANMVIGIWNRNYQGLGDKGNIGKNGQPIPKASKMYMEVLKGRETGIGHSSAFDLDGKTGKLSSQQKAVSESNGVTAEKQVDNDQPYKRGSSLSKGRQK